MKKNLLIFSLLSLIILIYVSCDKIETPYKETKSSATDTVKYRKILLEDFTAHKCPNCPGAAATAQQLKERYGENLIIISVHAGGLADADPYGPWAYDFTTPEGDDLYNTYEIGNSIPKGLINRTQWGTANFVLSPGNWGPRIESIKKTPAQLLLEIHNTFSAADSTVTSNIECNVIKQIQGAFKITACITEDSIIKPQEYQDSVSYKYVHRHVLRSAMNGIWGDNLFSGNIPAGSEFTKTFSKKLTADSNPDHCSVVVYIYNTATNEIIQAEEEKVK